MRFEAGQVISLWDTGLWVQVAATPLKSSAAVELAEDMLKRRAKPGRPGFATIWVDPANDAGAGVYLVVQNGPRADPKVAWFPAGTTPNWRQLGVAPAGGSSVRRPPLRRDGDFERASEAGEPSPELATVVLVRPGQEPGPDVTLIADPSANARVRRAFAARLGEWLGPRALGFALECGFRVGETEDIGAPRSDRRLKLRRDDGADAGAAGDPATALKTLLGQINARWPNRTLGRQDGVQLEGQRFALAITDDSERHVGAKLPRLASLAATLGRDSRLEKSDMLTPGFFNSNDTTYLRIFTREGPASEDSTSWNLGAGGETGSDDAGGVLDFIPKIRSLAAVLNLFPDQDPDVMSHWVDTLYEQGVLILPADAAPPQGWAPTDPGQLKDVPTSWQEDARLHRVENSIFGPTPARLYASEERYRPSGESGAPSDIPSNRALVLRRDEAGSLEEIVKPLQEDAQAAREMLAASKRVQREYLRTTWVRNTPLGSLLRLDTPDAGGLDDVVDWLGKAADRSKQAQREYLRNTWINGTPLGRLMRLEAPDPDAPPAPAPALPSSGGASRPLVLVPEPDAGASDADTGRWQDTMSQNAAVYARATYSSPRIAGITAGTPVRLLERARDDVGAVWARIEWAPGFGRGPGDGWVRSELMGGYDAGAPGEEAGAPGTAVQVSIWDPGRRRWELVTDADPDLTEGDLERGASHMATYLLENRPETTGYALLHTLSQGDTVIQGEKNTAQTSQRYGDTGLWLPYASDKATGVQRLWTPRRTYFRRWFMPGEPLRFDF